MKTIRFILPLIVVIAIAAVLIHRHRNGNCLDRVESIKIGTHASALPSLIFVANEKGFFEEKDVKVRLQYYTNGRDAVLALLKGKVEVATAAEFVVSDLIVQHPELRILTAIAAADTMKIVARKDLGITSIHDLRGKRIGVSLGTQCEFFLSRTLSLNGVSVKDVTLEDLSLDSQSAALERGEIDAALIWEPVVLSSEQKLRQNTISWSAQQGQPYFWLLISTADVLSKNRRKIDCAISSLSKAEEFMAGRRMEAEGIVEKVVGRQNVYWGNQSFKLTLDQSLLVIMEDEARWLMTNRPGLYKVPNLLEYIYFDGLSSIKPEAVSIR